MTARYEVRPIGYVESPLVDSRAAPKQGFEGAPEAWLVFNADVAEAARDLAVGAEVFVLTWLHRARRDLLAVHPRDDPRNPETGVFSTRSQDRPNPIGLHRVRIAAVDGLRVLVRDLEAVDGTPIMDVKPVLDDGRCPPTWPSSRCCSRASGRARCRSSRSRPHPSPVPTVRSSAISSASWPAWPPSRGDHAPGQPGAARRATPARLSSGRGPLLTAASWALNRLAGVPVTVRQD